MKPRRHAGRFLRDALVIGLFYTVALLLLLTVMTFALLLTAAIDNRGLSSKFRRAVPANRATNAQRLDSPDGHQHACNLSTNPV